jgi:hypothetical protein
MAAQHDLTGYVDWSTASVQAGRLTVRFAASPASAWTERVAEVLDRLERPGAAWGAIKVKRKRLRVKSVQPGAEADLRLLIEAAVRQADADLALGDTGPRDERSAADAAMTEAFRSFAEPTGVAGDPST